MNDGQIIDILAFPLLFTIWALIHSLMASNTVKNFVGRSIGRFAAFYRLFYVAFSLATFAAVWFIAPRPSGNIYIIGGTFYYILKGVQTLALIGFLFAGAEFDIEDFLGFREAGRYFSSRLDTSAPEPLNTGGLYGYMRHPLYSFGMLILWSDPEMTVSWFIFSLSLSAYLVIGSIFEERKLVAVYGEQYVEYRKRVRRFVPIRKSRVKRY